MHIGIILIMMTESPSHSEYEPSDQGSISSNSGGSFHQGQRIQSEHSEQESGSLNNHSGLNGCQSSEEIQVQNKLILVRTPFHFPDQPAVQRVLKGEILNHFSAESPKIRLQNPKLAVDLIKKKIEKPMVLVRAKKMRHRQTGKTIRVIQQTRDAQSFYDFEEMGDFMNSSSAKTLETLLKEREIGLPDTQTDSNQGQQEGLRKLITEQLQRKVLSADHSETERDSEIFLNLIQPCNYLKGFNFKPPNYDLLISKLKTQSHEPQSIFVSFENRHVPQQSSVRAVKSDTETELFKTISGYLEKRPCWLKNALYFKLYQDGFEGKFTQTDFKNVMKAKAYTFRNGPWKHTFCKLGFDPKKDPKSVIYQSVTIRLKEKQVEDYEQHIEEKLYDPTFTQISSRCIRSYQLCDIANREVSQVVHDKLASLSQKDPCTKELGWLTASEHARIMRVMKNYVDSQGKS